MTLSVDTCVLPRLHLEEAALYREAFGEGLGFELLPMFDMPAFEGNLRENLPFFESVPLTFHEPVWGVEHTAPRGTPAWEESMYHLELTRKYAEILRPRYMVYHLSNCPVPPPEKGRMLRTSLENLEATRALFPGCTLLLENNGIRGDGTLLTDLEEFTRLCLDRQADVLIDVGHANANGWDLFRLIGDLKDRIRGFHLHNNDGIHDLHNRLRDGTIDFRKLVPFIVRTVPDAYLVIEYTRPEFHGEPLREDILYLRQLVDLS